MSYSPGKHFRHKGNVKIRNAPTAVRGGQKNLKKRSEAIFLYAPAWKIWL